MTSLLDQPQSTHDTNTTAARRLRSAMAAVRLSFMWFGVRKSLSAEQKAEAADSFGAGRVVPVGRQEAARHQAPSVQGRLGRTWTSHRSVEGP